jgi:hypothetical protein
MMNKYFYYYNNTSGYLAVYKILSQTVTNSNMYNGLCLYPGRYTFEININELPYYREVESIKFVKLILG